MLLFTSRARLCTMIICLLTSTAQAQFDITNLTVEYLRQPLGIDVEKPRFGWQMQSGDGKRGRHQIAYQIEMTDEEQETVWNSGKIVDDISSGILYQGPALQPTHRYEWTVHVWDQDNHHQEKSSWFETGLLNPAMTAWDGAQWIGGGTNDLVLYSHYLSVFKVEFTLQMDEATQSTRAGFVIGANDHRLLDRDMNIFGIESQRDESYIEFELDISHLVGSEGGGAKMHIYRVGYHPDDDRDTPLKTIEIPGSKISTENKYEAHEFMIASIFGTITLFVDGESEADLVAGTRSGFGGGPDIINVNPMGTGGDFISFPMLADIGFSMKPGQKARFSEVHVRNYREPANILFQENPGSNYDGIYADSGGHQSGIRFEDGNYVLSGEGDGMFLVADPSRNAMPMLRHEFESGSSIARARLYITARGIYEVYLNGDKVSDYYFTPGLTQYDQTHMYQTYDITDLMQNGSNAVGIWLGEGWWSGNATFRGSNWHFFGDRQSVLAKLEIEYEDGSQQIVISDPDQWKIFTEGPIRYGSFFQGEAYDATRESLITGWSQPGFDDSQWSIAQNVPLDGTTYQGMNPGMGGQGITIDYENMSLIGQIGNPPSVVKEITAQSVDEVRPGVFVYDMGQNMVGVPRILLNQGEAGDKIWLRYAEVLYPDLPEYGENIGMVMLENIRGAFTHDSYVLKEGENIIQPRFTFHGYRYLEITGIDHAIPLENVKGLVISSITELTANYESSNENVNKLFENITWSQYGNFLSVPTDCPQRNERMGWSGDLSVFSRTSTYLANIDQFFRRHLFNIRDVQYSDGRYADIAPLDFGFGGILWGSAGITVPWEAYQQYGDIQLLTEHYASMQAYMSYLETQINDEGLQVGGRLGDWLSPEGNKNDNSLLFSAYYLFDLEIMAKIADVLGKENDAQKYQLQYEERKDHFNATYIDSETHRTIKSSYRSRGFGNPPPDENEQDTGKKFMDTQASYALPLAFDVIDEKNEDQVAANFAETIQRRNTDDQGIERPNYSLMTGFIGTAWINQALCDHGYIELAYRLLQQESYPSWLYPVTQGATTIWERLNSYTHEDGFGGNNSMNSFNHYSFGAIGYWLMAYSLGIRRDVPGFKNFALQPIPDPTEKMQWAEGYYDSIYGRISSRWEYNPDGSVSYFFTIPDNTIATVYMEANVDQVTEHGKPLSEVEGVVMLDSDSGKTVLEVVSGQYEFVVQ